jgi:hypothetical protein
MSSSRAGASSSESERRFFLGIALCPISHRRRQALTSTPGRKFLARPAPPSDEFRYYGVPGLDTIRGREGIARAAEILGSTTVAAGFEPSVPREGNYALECPV